MQAIEAHLEYLTRQTRVNDLICQGGCDSATLYIAKFPYVMSSKGLDKKTKSSIEEKKKKELQDFCRRVERRQQVIDSSLLLPEIPGNISFTAVNKGRLLVNHTGGIVENSNLSLHRFFGCPTIPGSALKGIARNAARFDEDKERFARVFGGAEKGKSDQAGSVSFLMAIPAILGGLVLELYKMVKEPPAYDIDFTFGAAMILAMLVAAISGYFAVRFMIRLITKKGLFGFAIYTGALGLIVLILQITGALGFGFTPFGG